MDTIYALSSGRPPAAIAVMRISGPDAFDAATALAGTLPPEREARVRTLRDAEGNVLDRALTLCFRAPATATGEDLVELHLHGGRAVVAAVERALEMQRALRPAVAGEFTRRALQNGRIDFFQAQGLADLLEAETESQRRAAIAASEGFLGQAIDDWIARLADLSARVEAVIDYPDEGDVCDHGDQSFRIDLQQLAADIANVLARPSVERLRDGHIVVLAGPPNAGKSSLFNAMVGRQAAIVTDIAGTTRDAIEASVVRNGQAFRLVDTAGLALDSVDPVERIGIERASDLIQAADLVLWLGEGAGTPDRGLQVRAKADLRTTARSHDDVSIFDQASVDRLWATVEGRLSSGSAHDDIRLQERQRVRVKLVHDALADAETATDEVLVAENIRVALSELSSLRGLMPTELMLTALFGRFCVGK